MAQIEQRSLIFYIGDVGFLLQCLHIVEIVGEAGGTFDFRRSDVRNHIVAALDFRNTYIPVLDPASMLKISSSCSLREKEIIILRGSEGNWALVVDEVDVLTDHEALLPCAVPDLLKPSSEGCYSSIRLINNRPYVVFEPENFYGAILA